MLEFDGFDWDDGNWPKCGKHGVGQDEIEGLFFEPSFNFEPAPEAADGERRWIGIGMSPMTGQWVLVIFTKRGSEPKVRPISARFMHAREVIRHVTR